jgi:hypothetical protein
MSGSVVVLQATLRTLGDAPTQSVTELAKRVGVAAADAAVMVVPLEGPPPTSNLPAAAAPAPAFTLLARWHGAAHQAPPEPA